MFGASSNAPGTEGSWATSEETSSHEATLNGPVSHNPRFTREIEKFHVSLTIAPEKDSMSQDPRAIVVL